MTETGFNASTPTVTVRPAPSIVTVPDADSRGALGQSMCTHRRLSFSTVPRASLTTIHGALAVAVKANGAAPRLNTSM